MRWSRYAGTLPPDLPIEHFGGVTAALALHGCDERNLFEGEIRLHDPAFEDLPALIETPGPDGRGPDRNEVRTAKRLRRDGLARRG